MSDYKWRSPRLSIDLWEKVTALRGFNSESVGTTVLTSVVRGCDMFMRKYEPIAHLVESIRVTFESDRSPADQITVIFEIALTYAGQKPEMVTHLFLDRNPGEAAFEEVYERLQHYVNGRLLEMRRNLQGSAENFSELIKQLPGL